MNAANIEEKKLPQSKVKIEKEKEESKSFRKDNNNNKSRETFKKKEIKKRMKDHQGEV